MSLTTDDNIPKGPKKSKSRRPPKNRDNSSYSHDRHAAHQRTQSQDAGVALDESTITTNNGGGAAQSNSATSAATAAGLLNEKKVRSLLKKLRAIEDLKMRQAAGEKLEATQVQKILTEDVVRRELEGSGGVA